MTVVNIRLRPPGSIMPRFANVPSGPRRNERPVISVPPCRLASIPPPGKFWLPIIVPSLVKDVGLAELLVRAIPSTPVCEVILPALTTTLPAPPSMKMPGASVPSLERALPPTTRAAFPISKSMAPPPAVCACIPADPAPLASTTTAEPSVPTLRFTAGGLVSLGLLADTPMLAAICSLPPPMVRANIAGASVP